MLPQSKRFSLGLLLATGALSLTACAPSRPVAETTVAPASTSPSTVHPVESEPEQSPTSPQRSVPSSTSVAVAAGPTTTLTVAAPPPISAPPARLVIDALDIDVPLTRLGVMPSGALEVPENPYDVGWWRSQRHVGPTVIVGHVDSRTGPAVFFRLAKLAKGDRIVVHSDGRRGSSAQAFVVRDLERVSKSRFPSSEVYQGAAGDLRLVTCGGKFDRRTGHYVDNVIVFATPTV